MFSLMRCFSLSGVVCVFGAQTLGGSPAFTDVTVLCGMSGWQQLEMPLLYPAGSPMIAGGCIGDFNKDGWQDIVSMSLMDNSLFWIRNERGSFSAPIEIDGALGSFSGPSKALIADLDNDGDLDVAAISDGALAVYKNDGAGNFTKELISPGIITENYDLTSSDVDGDGFVDLIVGGVQPIIYRNVGGTFSYDEARSQSIVVSGLIFVVRFADIDADGDEDLLLDGAIQQDIRWYANDGNGFYSLAEIVDENSEQLVSLDLTDLDGDGFPDILRTFAQAGEIVWYRNQGTGTFGSKQTVSHAQVPFNTVVASSDADGYGRVDIFWAEPLSVNFNRIPRGFKRVFKPVGGTFRPRTTQ